MRVALVDKSSRSQVSISRLLSAEGHDVLVFENPADALARLKDDTAIDALIVGADGERFSGVDFCREARRVAGKQRAIYLLVMSPNDDRQTKVRCLNLGADDVIDMPPSPDELLARLRVAERVVALQRSATTDYLSGAYNRRAFFGEAEEACRKGSLAVILLDIDHLKKINDQHGHDVGDAAVRAVANVAQADDAIVGRLGGDEFSIVLKEYSLTHALEIAANVQQRLAEVQLKTSEGVIGVTCSLGVAEFQSGDSIDDLIKRADLALYRAKEEGRNRVASEPLECSPTQSSRLRVARSSLPRPSPEVRERRNGLPTSEGLLARVCALVDLLIASGLDEELATDVMARKMMAADVPTPKSPGGTNWWRSIQAWRAAARNGVATAIALSEYQNVVAALESVSPQSRVTCALENELWNRRRLVLNRPPDCQTASSIDRTGLH